MRRFQIYRVCFCLGVIWEIILKNVKMDHTKIDTAYLDSPCRGLSVRGLGFVAALSVFFRGLIFRICALGVQSNPAVGKVGQNCVNIWK